MCTGTAIENNSICAMSWQVSLLRIQDQITPAGQGWPLWGSCVENVQESEIGDVRPMSHGSDSLQNGQKYDIMRVLRTSYVMFFAQNQIFHLKWFANMEVNFYEKNVFFLGPTFRSFPS